MTHNSSSTAATVAAATNEDRDARRQRILDLLRAAPALERMADELADLPDGKAFGRIEYTLRDLGHELAANAHQAGLDAGKKRGTWVRASPAPTARATPAS